MKNQKGYTIVELLVVVWALVIIGVVGTLGYVAVHFISKLW